MDVFYLWFFWCLCGLYLLSGWFVVVFFVGVGLFFVFNNDLLLCYEFFGLWFGVGFGIVMILLLVVSVFIECRVFWFWVCSLLELLYW